MTIEQLLTDLIIALKENTAEIRAANSNYVECVANAVGEAAIPTTGTTIQRTEKIEAAEESILTFEMVRDAIRKLAAADRPAAEALLAKFDVSKISQLEGKPEVWQEAYAEATK